MLEGISSADRELIGILRETDETLAWQYSMKAATNEQLQGQAFWDNNKRISEELFQLHFNMSISIAKEVSFCDTLD